MVILIGWTLILVFLFLSFVHFYWGLGGKWGSTAVIPITEKGEKTFNPGLVACFLVGFALLAVAAFIVIKLGYYALPLPKFILNYGLLLLASVFLLRTIGDFKYVGLFKRIKNTAFAENDTRFFSPLCVCIALLLTLLHNSL